MRFVRLAIAAVILSIVQLALCWRVSLLGVAPDLLLVLTAFAAMGLRPVERIPVACCIGLWSDFLIGHRLGLMALGYGLGIWATDALMPASGRWQRSALGVWPARAAHAMGMTLLASAVAHASVALVATLLGDTSGRLGTLAIRAGGISLYTAAVCPAVWLVLALTLGSAGLDTWHPRRRMVEG